MILIHSPLPETSPDDTIIRVATVGGVVGTLVVVVTVTAVIVHVLHVYCCFKCARRKDSIDL